MYWTTVNWYTKIDLIWSTSLNCLDFGHIITNNYSIIIVIQLKKENPLYVCLFTQFVPIRKKANHKNVKPILNFFLLTP